MAYYGGAQHFEQNQQQYSQPYAQPYAQQQPYGGLSHASMGGGDPSKSTLWMGELEPYMDEAWIRQVWYSLGENCQVKMIRDKYSGQNAGYCFVDFGNNPSALKALTTLQGTCIPGTNRPFRLNWASGGGLNDRTGREDRTPEFSVFVGDLGSEVTDQVLFATFQGRYTSLKSAKVVTDPATGGSRGYGFVRFHDEGEQVRALSEMQGVYCGTRPMRISMATPKSKLMQQGQTPMGGMAGMGGMQMGGMQQSGLPQGNVQSVSGQPYYAQAGPVAVPQGVPLNQFTDPNNTTVFVGGLSGVTHEEELKGFFAPFGEVTYVKIPPGKGCGFVQFLHRQSAEMAIAQLNGAQIGNSRVRLSWGRAQADKGFSRHSGAFGQGGPGMGGGYQSYGGQGPASHQQNFSQPPSNAMAPAAPTHTAAAPPLPSASQSAPVDPLEVVPVEKQNETFISGKEALIERLETDGTSSWPRGIYAQ